MKYNFKEFYILPVAEAATGGILYKKVYLKIVQNLQENTCVRLSFLLKKGFGTGVYLWILRNF